MAPSSSGLGRRPLKAEVAGSNPVGATRTFRAALGAALFVVHSWNGEDLGPLLTGEGQQGLLVVGQRTVNDSVETGLQDAAHLRPRFYP